MLLHRAIYERARSAAGPAPSPSVVIMDGQSVETTERGGTRGFDGYKRVKGRKRHILVDMLGPMTANRVEPANTSDRRAGARLLAGLSPLFPRIKTVIADAGHAVNVLSRSSDSPGLWSAPLHGSAATADSARTMNIECNIRDSARYCRHASHAQSTGIRVKLFKHALRSSGISDSNRACLTFMHSARMQLTCFC